MTIVTKKSLLTVLFIAFVFSFVVAQDQDSSSFIDSIENWFSGYQGLATELTIIEAVEYNLGATDHQTFRTQREGIGVNPTVYKMDEHFWCSQLFIPDMDVLEVVKNSLEADFVGSGILLLSEFDYDESGEYIGSKYPLLDQIAFSDGSFLYTTMFGEPACQDPKLKLLNYNENK